MPQRPDNNTLQAQLLRRATNIGPEGTSTPLPKDLGMENQQPDPLSTILNLGGDPMQNIGLEAAPPAAGAEKVYDLIRGGWSDLRPAITTGKPIEALLDVLKQHILTNPPRTPQVIEDVSTAGRKIPRYSGRINPPEGFAFSDPTIERNRAPAVMENVRKNAVLASRRTREFNKLPLEEQIKQRGTVEDAARLRGPNINSNGEVFYREQWRNTDFINPDKVKSIRAMAATGMPPEDIQKKFPKINADAIANILARNTWAWVK